MLRIFRDLRARFCKEPLPELSHATVDHTDPDSLLARKIGKDLQCNEANGLRYATFCLNDGRYDQEFLLCLEPTGSSGQKYPIRIYPLKPSPKELFGFSDGALPWQCCLFGMENEPSSAGEVMIMTPTMTGLLEELQNGGWGEDQVEVFWQELLAWTQHTAIPRKFAMEIQERNPDPEKLCYCAKPSPKCSQLILSNRAYNSIYAEVLSRDPLETSGFFMGHLSGGKCYVVEATDPGIHSLHTEHRLKLDAAYFNHLFAVIPRLYHKDLFLMGLWHRHPGSFDRFSTDDHGTNRKFAKAIGCGTLSMLVNMDPDARLTCYYLDCDTGMYHPVSVIVGDQYFAGTDYLQLATSQELTARKAKLQEELRHSKEVAE